MSSYLGQNFLKNPKAKKYIADTIARMYTELGCEAIIEIGPGKGALTRKICQISPSFFVIERDETLVHHLEGIVKSEHIILNDVLDVDVHELLKKQNLNTKKTLVVGNLPYYITSPIIRKFFANASQQFAGGVYLIQKEVGEKIMRDAPKKSYLRRLINFAHIAYYKRTVGPNSFSPPPKVDSCVISIEAKKPGEQFEGQTDANFQKLQLILDQISAYKRKTLGKIYKMLQKKHPDMDWTIPEHLHAKRLEEVARDEMLEIISSDCKA